MLCLKERSLQKRNIQNSNFKEENSSRFYSWGLQTAIVKKDCLIVFFLLPLFGDNGGVFVTGLLILSYQSYRWQTGYGMGRGVMDLCCTCLETCLELPKISLPDFLYSYLMDQFEASRRLDEHQRKQLCSAWKFTRDYIKITLELYRSFCLHERGSCHFWSSYPCTHWLMTADVLARSPTMRPPQLNGSARPYYYTT